MIQIKKRRNRDTQMIFALQILPLYLANQFTYIFVVAMCERNTDHKHKDKLSFNYKSN